MEPAVLIADARERLVDAALEMFGQSGYAGTSTRALATRAGTNLSAILYYFEGKQGLYLAAIERAAHLFLGPIAADLDAATAFIAGGGNPIEARIRLVDLAGRAIAVSLDDRPGQAEAARFIVYHLLDPGIATETFRRAVMEPLSQCFAGLIAIATGRDVGDPKAMLQATGMLGEMLMFRLLQGSPYDRHLPVEAIVEMIRARAGQVA